MADTHTQINDEEGRPTIDTGAPVPVSVEFVESQLNELWRDVAEAARATGGTQAVTTAQVLNLIVRVESISTASYTEDIHTNTGKHPCRVIFMISDTHEPAMQVQAWVSIFCQLPPSGGRQVCCEQVTMAASGANIRQMPAAVLPLLISGLPVFLWWPEGSPFDDFLFRQLADSIDRLIVDTSAFENPEGGLARMAARLPKAWPNVAVTDMNWNRLTRWREMVAQFFDGPQLRTYLDRIGQVDIDFALAGRGKPVNRAQAMMLAGWLASRLGWQPIEPVYQLVHTNTDLPATTRLTLSHGGTPVTINLNPCRKPSDVSGDLCSVRLKVPGDSPEDKPQAVFSVDIDDKKDRCVDAVIAIKGSKAVHRVLPMESLSRAELLDIELELYSHDKVYEEALALVDVFIHGTAAHATKANEGPRRVPMGEPISAGSKKIRPNGARST